MQEKSNILDNIRKRIIYIADNQFESRDDFLTKTGLKKGIFDNKDIDRAVGSDKISNILECRPDISADWIITGTGNMLVVKSPVNKSIKANSEALSSNQIPLVSVSVIAGFGSNDFAIGKDDVKAFYIVPKFKERQIDFMIEVSGSSMYPKYNSGDIVACKIINESKFIQWNKVHVLATRDQGILIKRLRQSKDASCLLAVSENESYQPFDIPREEITGIALVVGVIRLE